MREEGVEGGVAKDGERMGKRGKKGVKRGTTTGIVASTPAHKIIIINNINIINIIIQYLFKKHCKALC